MTDFISFRTKKELRELAEHLAGLESRKLSDDGGVSLGEAAEIAGLSLWEMPELLREHN